MKVLIVDDEPKVCQLIKNLINWQELNLQIAGEAHNGLEALDIIKTNTIDIVITDIRMPGMNGIEFIKELQRINPSIICLVISGHSDFEYARSALRFGAVDYLLKPVKGSELRDSLHRAIEQQYFTGNKESYKRTRKSFISDTYNNKLAAADIATINESYLFSFKQGAFQGFIVKTDCIKENAVEYIAPIQSKISKIFASKFKGKCFDYELAIVDSKIIGVCNYSLEDHSFIQLNYQGFLDELINLKNDLKAPIDFSLGVGSHYKDILGCHESLAEGEKAVAKRILATVGEVYLANNLEPQLDSQQILSHWNNHMRIAIESLDQDQVSVALLHLQNHVKSQPGAKGWEILQLLQEAARRLVILLEDQKISNENFQPQLENLHKRISRTSREPDIWNIFFLWVEGILENVIYKLKSAPSVTIRLAQKYISENFQNPITLEIVSEQVDLNASYFSSLFKKEMNQNFIDYLTVMRIEKAKQLLVETNDIISSIAQQVGYSDVKHFNKLFKKYSVLKPNEYRKFYS